MNLVSAPQSLHATQRSDGSICRAVGGIQEGGDVCRVPTTRTRIVAMVSQVRMRACQRLWAVGRKLHKGGCERESEGCGVGARQGPDDSERVRVCVCACVHLCVCACVRVCERAPATCEAFAPSMSKYPA